MPVFKSFKEAIDNSASSDTSKSVETEKDSVNKEKARRAQELFNREVKEKREEEKRRRDEEARKRELNSLDGYFGDESTDGKVSSQ